MRRSLRARGCPTSGKEGEAVAGVSPTSQPRRAASRDDRRRSRDLALCPGARHSEQHIGPPGAGDCPSRQDRLELWKSTRSRHWLTKEPHRYPRGSPAIDAFTERRAVIEPRRDRPSPRSARASPNFARSFYTSAAKPPESRRRWCQTNNEPVLARHFTPRQSSWPCPRAGRRGRRPRRNHTPGWLWPPSEGQDAGRTTALPKRSHN